MTDKLELLRHELADVEQAIADADVAPRALLDREDELRQAILELERAAREEAGVQPETVDATAEEVAESRPAATDLVVPPLPPGEERDHATLLVLDRHDEDQVLSQIEDRMDKVLMYDFSRGGTRVVDLSVNGVFECVRLLNATGHARIGVVEGSLSVAVEAGDDGPEYVVDVAARDEVSGLTLYASATEPRMMSTRNGPKRDPFARQKAISKAQRNALKRHIPERLRQGMLALHRGDQARVLAVKHGAGAVAAAELPPPVATPVAQELERECRSLYQEVKGLPRGVEKMMPGAFGMEFARARSSEEALAAFRDRLVSLRDALKGAAS